MKQRAQIQNSCFIKKDSVLHNKIEIFLSYRCDVAIHRPSRQPGDIENPHVHVWVPMRSMDECGKWNAKQRREYIFDENGKYIFNAVKTNDWGEVATLEEWRKNWVIAV